MADLEARLLAAHAANDGSALVALYREAADQTTDLDAACFYLTHAWIFALEAGHPDTQALFETLHAHSRA